MDVKNKSTSPRRPAGPSSGRRRPAGAASRGGAVKRKPNKPSAAVRTVNRTARAPRRTSQPVKVSPDVVYTQPETFNRGRFILRLATVVAVVIALVFGMSIFFKVESVVVSGTNKYTAWDIREASGIRDGENLLGINAPRISTKVKAALPYVDTVRVGIKLPDTVQIEVVELDVVYAAQATDGSWWLLSSEGVVVDSTTSSESGKYTVLMGVELLSPTVGAQAVAAEPVSDETLESGQTIPVTVKGSDKLSAALSIFQYLEGAGVIGDAASVNVEDLSQIVLWYGERYQVKLGDTTQLKFKVESMKTAIDQMTHYQTGVLDVSFTTWPDEVGYNPFLYGEEPN